jgi:hypothetical protein
MNRKEKSNNEQSEQGVQEGQGNREKSKECGE